MNDTQKVVNPELWRDKAVAATIKAEKMLWGKHNETIQAWLYEAGFSLATMREAHLGWQVRNAQRPAESWGVDGLEKIHLPEGITIPVIREKVLKRIAIHRMGHGHDGDTHTVEGSAAIPLVLEGKTRRTVLVTRELDALLLHQELGKEWTVAATGILPPTTLEDALAKAQEIRLIAMDKDAERLAPWQSKSTRTDTLEGDSLISLARSGKLAEAMTSLFG